MYSSDQAIDQVGVDPDLDPLADLRLLQKNAVCVKAKDA